MADELLAQGAIASDHAELDIFRRMAALEVEAPGCSLLIHALESVVSAPLSCSSAPPRAWVLSPRAECTHSVRRRTA